jgi:TRAP-type C4-dicarboxylate transport system permease small subunit
LRNLGFGTLPWIVELSEYSLPAATFLAAPWLLRQDQLVRVDTLVAVAPRRVGFALKLIVDIMGLAISLVFVRYTLAVIADARRLKGLVIKTLVFPEWWLFLPLIFCSVLLAVEFLRRIAARLAQAKAMDGG